MSSISNLVAFILFSCFFLIIWANSLFGQLAPPQPVTISIIQGAANPNILNSFFPSSIELPIGTNITWINNDANSHTVTSFTNSFDSGIIDPLHSWSNVFYNTGYYGYYCKLHPYMNGSVKIR
jgi:plastocyanin